METIHEILTWPVILAIGIFTKEPYVWLEGHPRLYSWLKGPARLG